MRKSAVICLLFVITAVSSAGAEASWTTAVTHYSSGEEKRPHSMEVLSKTFNGKGEIEKTEKMLFSLSYDADGEVESEIVRITENGVDITEKRKKENRNPQGGGPPGDSDGFDKNPFDPELQNDVTAVNTNTIQYKRGQRCQLWSFRLKINNNHDAVGTAWISLETGAAVSLEYHLEPDFPFVEEMNITLNYLTDNSGTWLLEEMHFIGRLNLIIMKKGFDALTKFSDYR